MDFFFQITCTEITRRICGVILGSIPEEIRDKFLKESLKYLFHLERLHKESLEEVPKSQSTHKGTQDNSG